MWRKRSIELTLEFRVGSFNIYTVLCYWQWIAYCVVLQEWNNQTTLEVTYLRHFVEYNSILLQLLCFLMKWRNFWTTSHKLNPRFKETAKNMKRARWIVWTTWKFFVLIFWLTTLPRDSRCRSRDIHVVWKGGVSSINPLLKSLEPEISPHIVCYIIL